MRHRLLAASLLALALIVAPASAHAATKPVFGYGDQRPEMFSDPRFAALGLHEARYVVAWDVFSSPQQTAGLDRWMSAARAAGVNPLIAIEHSRRAGRMMKAPTDSQYVGLIRALRARYPWVTQYTPWNEANFRQQPTYRRPRLAARYYQLMRANCRGCTVTSPVYLDLKERRSRQWLADFKKATHGRVRLWAVHVYGDVNRFTDANTRRLLAGLPGKVWVTETAGWVAFAQHFPYSEARAARAIAYNFTLARRYRSKVARWYFYEWVGVPKGSRWDSGVIGTNGTPRRGYYALKQGLRAAR